MAPLNSSACHVGGDVARLGRAHGCGRIEGEIDLHGEREVAQRRGLFALVGRAIPPHRAGRPQPMRGLVASNESERPLAAVTVMAAEACTGEVARLSTDNSTP